MNELSRRYLYIDESGTPYLNDSRSSFFILIGVHVSGFSNAHPLYYLDDIFRKYNIKYNQNFHAVDLFEPIRDKKGNFHSKYISNDKKAKKLVLEIADFIQSFPLVIDVYFLRKKIFLKTLNLTKNKIKKSTLSKHHRKEINFLPYSYSIVKMIFNFARQNKVRYKEKLGSVIFENRPENDLIVSILEKAKNPDNFNDEKTKIKTEVMNKYIASVQFSNKKACYPGLALADIIGFALHQRYARKILRFEKRGLKELLKVIDEKSSIAFNQVKLSREIKKHLFKETLNKISKI